MKVTPSYDLNDRSFNLENLERLGVDVDFLKTKDIAAPGTTATGHELADLLLQDPLMERMERNLPKLREILRTHYHMNHAEQIRYINEHAKPFTQGRVAEGWKDNEKAARFYKQANETALTFENILGRPDTFTNKNYIAYSFDKVKNLSPELIYWHCQSAYNPDFKQMDIDKFLHFICEIIPADEIEKMYLLKIIYDEMVKQGNDINIATASFEDYIKSKVEFYKVNPNFKGYWYEMLRKYYPGQ